MKPTLFAEDGSTKNKMMVKSSVKSLHPNHQVENHHVIKYFIINLTFQWPLTKSLLRQYDHLISNILTNLQGDVAGAGTDANVFICIFGDKGDTGNRVLTSQKNAFERNQVDIFNIEAEDVGVLKKIRIGHGTTFSLSNANLSLDNKGIGASWFLESVTITNEKRGTWTFPCNKWFDKEHDDKQLVRDVYTDEQQATATETMYTITVVTGNLRGAGTSSKVSVNIFGEKGETGDRSLENARDNFARGKTDSFEISAMELGDLRKLRIGVCKKIYFQLTYIA